MKIQVCFLTELLVRSAINIRLLMVQARKSNHM